MTPGGAERRSRAGAAPLGLGAQLLLLWRVRAASALGGTGGAAGLTVLLGAGLLLVISVGTALGAFELVTRAAMLGDPRLRAFLVLLVGFLVSTMWILWPIVTATVDDSAELTRFACFPVSPGRLLLASVLASTVEPRTFPLWGAMVGTALALADSPGAALAAVVATPLLALVGAVWGRAGLHLLLNVLRHRRSAEALGGGLLLLLFGSLLVPPPDLSWLQAMALSPGQVNAGVLVAASILFAVLPTGGWASAMLAADSGRTDLALAALAYLALTIAFGWFVALALLRRFYRQPGGAVSRREPRGGSRSFTARGVFAVLLERELRELVMNPRARLMVAMPFFLAILLKLIGARSLLVALIGPDADAWLLAGLASYGSLVLAFGFGQNAFGYDGPGASVLLGAPIELPLVVRAKNLVHGGLALLMAAALVVFYRLFIAAPPLEAVAFAFALVLFQAFFLLAVGNVTSVLAPKRFFASMKRRDRPPPVTVAVGLGAAVLAVAPARPLLAAVSSGGWALAALVLLPAAGAAAWAYSVGLATRLLEADRRPALLRALARQ